MRQSFSSSFATVRLPAPIPGNLGCAACRVGLLLFAFALWADADERGHARPLLTEAEARAQAFAAIEEGRWGDAFDEGLVHDGRPPT